MQKKLIALAVASVASGAAFAQTNVTLYGVADAGYVYSTGSASDIAGVRVPGSNTFSGVQSGLLSGSRIGFRGEEALGNGLKAIFTLEYGINVDTNSGIGNTDTGLNARQQFVGLSGERWGSITLGRQYAPGYQATANNDPAGGAVFEPQSFLSAQAGNSITPNSPARWNNAIAYTTPNWSGFSAKAIYSFGERQDANKSYNDKLVGVGDNGSWGIGANYANGPINVDLVYQQRTNVYSTKTTANGQDSYSTILSTPGFNTTLPVATAAATLVTQELYGRKPTDAEINAASALLANDGHSINEWYIGGSYDFKVVKVMASYQAQNDNNPLNLDNKLWTLGAVIPVLSASNIRLGYGQLIWDNPINGKTNSAMLGWTTALSKRSTLYAGYVWTRNDSNSLNLGPVSGVGGIGETNNTFLAGINHAF